MNSAQYRETLRYYGWTALYKGNDIMAKTETREGWDGCDEFIGAGDLTVLGDDGESVVFFVVGKPVGMTSTKFQTETKRAVLPVVTVDGVSCIPLGARTYRKLSRQRAKLDTHAVKLTRHGGAGDTATFYEVQLVEISDELARAIKAMKPADVTESITAALEILAD